MPTDEWFKKIQAHIDFNGKSVIDYGCAEGRMCELAKDAGASRVVGIDEHPVASTRKDIEFILQRIEGKHGFDIKIFSMIIHWIGKEEFINQLNYSKEIVVIYRTPSSGYIEQNGIFFPTQEELDKLVGVKPIHTEHLMNQGEDKDIVLAIYDKA